MEDPRRNMAAGSTAKRKLKGRTSTREPLTIMVLKRTGTVWTGKVSALVLMGAGVFLCCYIVITLLVIYQHFELTRDQESSQAQQAELTNDLDAVHKNLERANHQLALLEAYITERREEHLAAAQKQTVVSEPTFPDPVDISQLTVAHQDRVLTVTFNIINTQKDTPISGHVFVLVQLKGADHDQMLVYPPCPLNDGLPVVFQRGQRFSIKRFKTITSTYALPGPLHEPLMVKILVYDDQGNVILNKTVEV
jgi:hypothetical protein